MIEKKLFAEDGSLQVEIESVDKVGEVIKRFNDEISSTITEGKKLEITADTDEKGLIHPEGDTPKANKDQLEREYAEAKKSGYTKSFDEFLKLKGAKKE